MNDLVRQHVRATIKAWDDEDERDYVPPDPPEGLPDELAYQLSHLVTEMYDFYRDDLVAWAGAPE